MPGAKQAQPAAAAEKQAAGDVNVKAQADKTAIKSAIKEKAVDLAKAGAKENLAALKDRDFKTCSLLGDEEAFLRFFH